MRFLKKILLYIPVASVFYLASLGFIEKSGPLVRSYAPIQSNVCDKPINYSIGNIDSQFGVSEEQLKKVLAEAEGVWEKESGKNLFEYDPQAVLKVGMFYDQRQQATNEAEKLEDGLKKLEDQRATINNKYDSLDNEYEKKLSQYKSEITVYKKRLERYSQNVQYWNDKGGAPEKEFEGLVKEKKNLSKDYTALQDEEVKLNNLIKEINNLAAREKKIVNNYNSDIRTFQNSYGGSQEFEKGVFDSTKGIAIYQFKENSDLRLTLIHELGHALGIDHVNNPNAIMYYLMADQNLDSPALSAEDITALKQVCK